MGIFGQLSGGQKALGALFAGLFGLIVLGGLWYVFPTSNNQGYAPEQPIPFSHKIHAGTNKIDCRYCHTGVTDSRHATIPSMNVCMNCHTVVRADSPYIQQLQKLYEEGKTFEWIRVHRLPDHARFNHAPHVRKGVDCTVCHGDVRQMDKIEQASPLTMGWCLQCHRGQDVPTSVVTTVKPDAKDKKDPGPLAPFQCTTCHY